MGKDKRGVLCGKCTKCSECKEFETTNSDAMLCEYCGHRPVEHLAITSARGNIEGPPQKKAKTHWKTFESESQDKLNEELTSEEEDDDSELEELEVKHSSYMPYSLP